MISFQLTNELAARYTSQSMMPPPLPADAGAALLQPWFSALVAMDLHPEVDKHYAATLEDPAPLWIKWVYPHEASVEQRTRMFEAIELFVLLASADPQGWRDMVKQLAAANPYWRPLYPWADALETTPQRRVTGYDIQCHDEDHVAHMHQFLASEQDPEDDIGREFTRVRAVLEAGSRGELVVIPVRLRIKSSLHHLLHFGEVLPSIAELAVFQSSIRGVDSNCRLARFRSRVQELHESDIVQADEQYLLLILQIHTHGIRIFKLPALRMELDEGNALVVMRALNTLLGDGGVRRVDLGDDPASLPVWSGVANSSVNSIEYRSPRRDANSIDLRRTIQWFAYAALRAREPTKTPMKIRCRSFSREEVQWIREIIAADDPLTVLFEEHHDGIEEFKPTRIATSRVSLFDPTASNEEVPTSHPMELSELRVLKREGKWWTVLVPGWGRGWVHDNDAVVTTIPTDSLVSPLPAQSARFALDVDIHASDDDSREATLELLQLIGSSVVSLHVADYNGPSDTWVPAVFTSCPNITNLSLDLRYGTALRFAPLLDSFASGLCPKLTDLSLSFDLMAYETCGDMGMLLRALADNSHAMARQIDSLSVVATYMSDGKNFVDSDVHEAALEVLKNNTHLAFLELDLPLATTAPENLRDMEQEFAKHHNVQLPEDCSRFKSREKSAFLSVAWGQDDSPASQCGVRCALQQFDSAVVANVFQFVRRPRHRLVKIKMPEPVHHDDEDEEQ